MKNLFAFSVMILLSACAEGSIYKQYDQDCNDHFYSSKACPAKKEIVQKKETKLVANDTTYSSKANKIRLVAQNERLPMSKSSSQSVQKRVYIEQPAVVPVETIKIEAPAPVVVAQPAPVVVADSGCNGCQPIVRQVREPVEVIYKKTTYTTVFEPKTTSTVTYEKEAITNAANVAIVKENNIKQVPVQKKTIKTVVTKPAVNSISYTIENTHTTAPSELLIEEIK